MFCLLILNFFIFSLTPVMDSEGDARSNSSMHVDSDADDYSDTCDYDEYNEGNGIL